MSTTTSVLYLFKQKYLNRFGDIEDKDMWHLKLLVCCFHEYSYFFKQKYLNWFGDIEDKDIWHLTWNNTECASLNDNF